MGATLFGGGNLNQSGLSNANNIGYMPLCAGWPDSISSGVITEFQCQQFLRAAGTFSRWGVRVTTNARVNNTNSSKLRKDTAGSTSSASASDTAVSVTITTSTTGWFEDTTNSVTAAAGDKMTGVQYNSASGNAQNLVLVSGWAKFKADSGTKIMYQNGCNDFATTTLSASTTYYVPLPGKWETTFNTSNTEADVQAKTKVAGTFSNLSVNVNSNGRSTATTMTFRKNTSAGNNTLSITASGTGIFEDTTNSDTVVVDDLFAIQLVTGTGSGTLSVATWGMMFASTSTDFDIWCAHNIANPSNVSTSVDNYLQPMGSAGEFTATESNSKMKLPMTVLVDMLRVKLRNNSATNTVNVTIRQNGSDTAQTVAITSGATGLFEDTNGGHGFVANLGDEINYDMTPPNSTTNFNPWLFGMRMNTSYRSNIGNEGTWFGQGIHPGN